MNELPGVPSPFFRISPVTLKIIEDAQHMAEVTRPLRDLAQSMRPIVEAFESMRPALEAASRLRPVIKLVEDQHAVVRLAADAARQQQLQLMPELGEHMVGLSHWLQEAPPIQLTPLAGTEQRSAQFLESLAPETPDEAELVEESARKIRTDPESISKIGELADGLRNAGLAKSLVR